MARAPYQLSPTKPNWLSPWKLVAGRWHGMILYLPNALRQLLFYNLL